MIYKNMTELAVPSADCVVKVGDTIADIKEGVNAKVWTVGVILGSNELGLHPGRSECFARRRIDNPQAGCPPPYAGRRSPLCNRLR